MQTRTRRLLGILAAVVVPIAIGFVVVLVLALTPWGNERVRRFAVDRANARLNGELVIGGLSGNLFSSAALTDVRVTDSAKHPVFAAKRVAIHYGLLAALRGQVVIQSVVLDTPQVLLDKLPGRRWNFQELMKPSAPRDTSQKRARPQIDNITIHHGRFDYRRPWTPDTALSPAKQQEAIGKALAPDARKRTERVANGFQRVLVYRDIDAHIPHVELADGAKPLAVQIGSLSMLGEPYRPPAIDIKSLVGTLYSTRDSLWWRGARMRLPGSDVSGDGTIGFHRSGFLLDLTGTPVALADLRWLDPKLPEEGGGKLRYRMHLHGDSAEYAVSNVDVKYQAASVVGDASVVRITHGKAPAKLVVRGADLTVAQVSTGLVRQFVPSFKFSRDGTLAGHVVARGAADDVNVDADLRFDDVAAGTSRVVAKGDVGFEDGIHVRGMHVRMLPLKLATAKGFGGKLPIGGTVTGETEINGASHTGWTVSGEIAHEDRGAVSRISGKGDYRVNGKRIVADAKLEPLSLVTVGRFAPKAELRGAISGSVHAEGTTRELRVTGDLRSTTGGSVTGRGNVTLAGVNTKYDVAIQADALNANVFSSRAPRTALTGTISARGMGTKLETMNSALAADLARSSYDTFSVDRLLARARIANGMATIDTLAVFERGARAIASGTFGVTPEQSGVLSFLVVADSLGSLRPWIGTSDSTLVHASAGRQGALRDAARADSAKRAEQVRIERLALGLPEGVALALDTLPPVRRDSLAGSLRVDGTLQGNTKAFGVTAHVNGTHLVARGMSASKLTGFVQTRGGVPRETAPIDFTLAADSVQASGRAFEQLRTAGTWADKRLTASLDLKQDARVSYAALGAYSQPAKGEHLVVLDSLRMRFDTLSWRLLHPARVRVSDERIDIDSLELRSSANGRLYANGTVPKAGVVRLDVAAENVSVQTVLDALQQDRVADGVIAASVRISGTRSDPLLDGRATLIRASWKGTRAPDVNLDARYSGKRLAVDATGRDTTGRRVFVSMASLPFDLALEPVKGTRQIAGALSADVTIDTLQIAALPFTTRAVEELHGIIVADAHVRGSWDTLKVTGRAGVRDAGFRMPLASTGMRVDGGVADLRFIRDTLFLDSLSALARGPIRASGNVAFANGKPRFVSFTASAENARVFDSPRGLVDANAQVIANGPLDSIRVTGHGEMLGGYLALKQFRKDLLRVKAPGSLSFFAVYDTSASPADRRRAAEARAVKRAFGVVADLSLAVDRGLYYRNRPDANTEFYTEDGEEVHAHLDARTSDQWAVGFVRIGGGVAFFRTRAFVPQRGALSLTPHTGATPLVQQVGERIVWEPGRGLFPLQMLTGGTGTGPAVGLESGALFPMRGRELNGYLTLGRLTLSLLQQSGSSLSGSEAWSGQLSGETGALAHRQQAATALGVVLHDIGTGATKEWSLDAFSVSPADVPTELVSGKTGGARGALIEGGKYVTTDLYVAGQLHFTRGIPGLRVSRLFGTTYRLDAGVEPRFLFRDVPELGITHPTVRSGAVGAYLTRLWSF